MRTNLAPLLVLGALTQGCGPIPVYTTADRASDKAGIGFFPIVAMDQSKRVYEQTWYELTVTRTLVLPSAADAGSASEKTKTQKTKTDKDKSKADKGAKSEEPTYEQKIVRYTDDPAAAAKVLRAFSEQERRKMRGRKSKTRSSRRRPVVVGIRPEPRLLIRNLTTRLRRPRAAWKQTQRRRLPHLWPQAAAFRCWMLNRQSRSIS